jgi:hypothetical protein
MLTNHCIQSMVIVVSLLLWGEITEIVPTDFAPGGYKKKYFSD